VIPGRANLELQLVQQGHLYPIAVNASGPKSSDFRSGRSSTNPITTRDTSMTPTPPGGHARLNERPISSTARVAPAQAHIRIWSPLGSFSTSDRQPINKFPVATMLSAGWAMADPTAPAKIASVIQRIMFHPP
jgi:hypothetical protein